MPEAIWHVRDRIDEDYLPRTVVRVFRRLCRVIPTLVVGNSNATLRTLQLPENHRTATIYSGIAFTPTPVRRRF